MTQTAGDMGRIDWVWGAAGAPTTGDGMLGPRAMLTETGTLFAIAIDGFRYTPQVGRWWREYVDQAWFTIKVSTLPVIFVSIPFGMIAALHSGSLALQLGAESATGTIAVMATVRELGPIVAALIVSGAAGAAVTADLGARTIRDEIAALEVMGVNPIRKLVTARLWACATVAVILLSFSIAASLGGAYVYNVLVQGVSTGAYLDGLTGLTVVADVVQAVIKAFVFGVLAGMVACYKGLTVERSPRSVGEAVNRQVITCFMLLFVVNLVISNLYFALVPAR